MIPAQSFVSHCTATARLFENEGPERCLHGHLQSPWFSGRLSSSERMLIRNVDTDRLLMNRSGAAFQNIAFESRTRLCEPSVRNQQSFTKRSPQGSSFDANPLEQLVGLGDATAVERVEIEWPVSGTRQVVRGIPINSAVQIIEGQEIWQHRDYNRFQLQSPE